MGTRTRRLQTFVRRVLAASARSSLRGAGAGYLVLPRRLPIQRFRTSRRLPFPLPLPAPGDPSELWRFPSVRWIWKVTVKRSVLGVIVISFFRLMGARSRACGNDGVGRAMGEELNSSQRVSAKPRRFIYGANHSLIDLLIIRSLDSGSVGIQMIRRPSGMAYRSTVLSFVGRISFG